MIFNSNDLLESLEEYVLSHIKFVKSLEPFLEADLAKRLSNDTWSVLECIEHLNLYADFYNKEINKRINNSKKSPDLTFKSGFLGNKISTGLLPSEEMKTMKTFKSKNPIHSDLNKGDVLQDFLNKQNELLKLLKISKTKNLTSIKTSLTIPFIKFRLGDTFRFVIYHNERHILQAKKLLQ